jgi:hypothetical protein
LHLYAGTKKQNAEDAIKIGVLVGNRTNGEVRTNAFFTAKQVLSIVERIRNGDALIKIARDNKVSRQTITAIKLGDSWSSVTGGKIS